MIIHINEGYFLRGKTGKGRFAQRLVRAWEDAGVELSRNPNDKADVAFHVGRMKHYSKAKKHVLRVGPACIDTNMDWKKINYEKAQAVKGADAIVYQSEYSRKIYHKLVCKPDKPEIVICNGADTRDYKAKPYDSAFQYNFLASTRIWTKQKRGKDLVKAFLDANLDDACLLFCGDNSGIAKKYSDRHNIMFFGPVGDDVLARLYRLVANTGAYLHGVYCDTCPNSVVEAQVAGCPVICTDQGGTHEILRYGALVHDKPFKYKPMNLNRPPSIDREAMANAIRYFALKQGEVDGVFLQPDDLYIEHVAYQYVKFFERIL